MHLIDVIEAHARRRADAPAVHFLADSLEIAQTLSFGDLHGQAQALAGRLQRRPASGERVLLALPSSLDYVLAFLACTYADRIAVPLFPPQSRKPRHLDRLRNVIADAEPALILCPEEAREVVDGLSPAPVCTLDALRAEADGAWARPASSGETVAFLQYTSGSSGTPKGVVVRQRNLLANLALMQRAYGFDPHGRMVNWLPLYHDMGLIGGLLAPLYAGMPCYLMAPQTFVKTPASWLQALSRHRGTASFAPNFAYALCHRTVSDALIAQLDLSAWEHAINGAEPIHAASLEAFRVRFAAAGFRAQAASPGYGQAEATLCVSATPRGALPVVLPLDKAALERGLALPAVPGTESVDFVACGFPQPGHDLVIVDPQRLTRCAPGRIGEIWLAGPSNAEGYWNRPQASRETFEARLADESGRYLRTGDLGFLHEGQVVVCGRLKDLIILNGRNLYPHDIEFAVTDAERGLRAGRIAAFAVPDASLGREKLIVVAEPHRRLADPGRHAALFARMQRAARDAADCAIDRIVLVEPGTIPMTTSGKISRHGARQAFLGGELSVVADSGGASASDTTTARQLLEGRACGDDAQRLCRSYLASAIRALGDGTAPDFDASLVANGLDSIALATLAARLQRELAWGAPLVELFGERSLNDWADSLLRHLQGTNGVAAPEPSPVGRADPGDIRQSYAQRRLWFGHRIDPERAQHNVVVHLHLRGPVSPERLQARLNDAVARHGALRTIYRDTVQGPVQQVLEGAGITLAISDLSGLAPSARHEAVQACMARERRTPFELGTGPLLRAELLRRADDEHDLVLSVHHIAFDGRSAELLLGELAGRAAPPSLRYVDFAAAEAARWNADARAAELDFWRSHLDGVPRVLVLGERGTDEALQAFHLSAALCDGVASAARGRGMTLFMALLALYQVVLQHASGRDRFLIGTDVGGRPPGFEDTLGFFVNQLPVRCDLRGDPTLDALFERVREEAQAVYAHQGMPFDLLVSALAPERVPGRAPLLQVKLNYQPSRTDGLVFDEARVVGLEVAQALGDFDLVLDLVHGRDGIAGTLKHRLHVERAASIQRLWLRLVAEFDALRAQPLSAIRALMRDWDDAGQHERRQAEAAQARSRLVQARRRPLTI